jgi:hypothetical protein
MEFPQKESVNPLWVRCTHEQYRRLLDRAVETDRRYPWLRQRHYLVCIAVVADQGVWLKLK